MTDFYPYAKAVANQLNSLATVRGMYFSSGDLWFDRWKRRGCLLFSQKSEVDTNASMFEVGNLAVRFFVEKNRLKLQKLTSSSSPEFPQNTCYCCWLQVFLSLRPQNGGETQGIQQGQLVVFRASQWWQAIMLSRSFNLPGFNHFWLHYRKSTWKS